MENKLFHPRSVEPLSNVLFAVKFLRLFYQLNYLKNKKYYNRKCNLKPDNNICKNDLNFSFYLVFFFFK